MKLKLPSAKEVGYLIGLIAGDGYLYHDKKSRHYNVEFYLNSIKDVDIQNFLLRILEKMDLRVNVRKDKRFNCNKIRVYSKSLYKFANKMLEKNKVNENFKIGFISGLVDADGYVSKKSHIEIINTKRSLMLKTRRFLNSLNIKTEIKRRVKSRKDKLVSYRLYVPMSFIKTKNISIKISRNKLKRDLS